MHSQYTKTKRLNGFTIIETIVVIAVIGILATIVGVGYNSWKRSTIETQLKSDLTAAANAMEDYRNFKDGYPESIPSTSQPSEGVILTGGGEPGGARFCIDATSSKSPEIVYHIDQDIIGSPSTGSCASRPIPPTSPATIVATANNNGTIGVSWSAVLSGNVTYQLQQSTNSVFSSYDVFSTSGTTYTTPNLDIGITYYFRVKAINPSGESEWSNTVSAIPSVTFDIIAAASNLRETNIGPTSSTHAWDAITCNIGTPQYSFSWVSPYSGTTAWSSSLSVTNSNDQGTDGVWNVQTRCVYQSTSSDTTTSSNHSFSTPVQDPVGSFGTISWDGRFTFNASSNTFACVNPADEQYRLIMTKQNTTSGSWPTAWSSSTAASVTGVNQGSQITTYMEVRCLYNGVSSGVMSSPSRVDNASIDAPGTVPGWQHVGNPKGERWSAVSCPAGTTASYWAYAVGDYSNPIWGAYEATGFYGYDRPGYTYGNTMVNSYLKARCLSSYTASSYGPESYARY